MYVNQIELDLDDYEYLYDNIDELDDILFAGMTSNEAIELESQLLGDFDEI